jgi:hypothetical protein
MGTGFLLGFLGVVMGLTGWRAWHRPSRENHALFGGILLLFVLIYCVSVLDLKIGGSGLTIEQAEKVRKDVYAAKEDIDRTAQAMLKASLVLADGASRYGGVPSVHKEQIQDYFKQLGKDEGFDYQGTVREGEFDIKQLDKKIEKQNQ